MKQLQEFAKYQPHWSLDEFVKVANQLLPEVLPDERANTRVREEVTARLVRYYTTQGMLDEPLKQGREARYQYRHLLQVLLLRRLLAAGYGAGAIAQFVVDRDNSELETLLQGDVGITIAATPPVSNNSALEFLQQIQTNPSPIAMPTNTAMPPPSVSKPIQPIEAVRESTEPNGRLTGRLRSSPPHPPLLSRSSQESPSDTYARRARGQNPPQDVPRSSQWQRIEIASGLELHISDSFDRQISPTERQKLLEAILQALNSLLNEEK